MRVRIDRAGRLTIPRPLRDAVGIAAGEVEVSVAGAALRVEAPAGGEVQRDGRLVIPRAGTAVDEAFVDASRDVGRR